MGRPEKRIVVTRADNHIRGMCAISHPIIKKFAAEWGADFQVLSDNRNYPHRHYRLFDLREILETYDRALSIDSDTLITPNCKKNPFDVVPKDDIGSIYEDVGSRAGRRREVIEKVQKRFGDVGWKSGYINTGFMVFSSRHRDIFNAINGEYWSGFGYDDAHLGWQIHKHGFEIYELHYKWNEETMFCEKWNRANRFKAFVIHYSGVGIFDDNIPDRIEQMRSDKGEMYGKQSL